MRKIRVRALHGPLLAQALRDAGFQAHWLGPGTAHMGFHGGCLDPDCCQQHPGSPQAYGAVLTNASGRQAHRVWVKAGLVPPCGCRVCRKLGK